MRPLAFLLYPFALIYGLITKLRNWFFDLGVLKSIPSSIPSVLVGNLSVGGTGKTPMIEFLIRMLKSDFTLGTLSRGYGRDKKGFRKANKSDDPKTIGDEPFQLFSKFGSEIDVFVGEDRVNAIREISSQKKFPDLILLDDAFQHRYLKSHFNILLTTFQKPFYLDFMLPMGRLREARSGAKRADMIIVTKCPDDLSLETRRKSNVSIQKYIRPEVPIIFSKIGYMSPYSLGYKEELPRRILLVSGIASDGPLVDYVRKEFDLIDVIRFSDHHNYSTNDLLKIKELLKLERNELGVLLTEKDAEKVKSVSPEGFLEEFPIFVLPMTVIFSGEDEQILKNLLETKIKENSY